MEPKFVNFPGFLGFIFLLKVKNGSHIESSHWQIVATSRSPFKIAERVDSTSRDSKNRPATKNYAENEEIHFAWLTRLILLPIQLFSKTLQTCANGGETCFADAVTFREETLLR
jgi:hypothetical protein